MSLYYTLGFFVVSMSFLSLSVYLGAHELRFLVEFNVVSANSISITFPFFADFFSLFMVFAGFFVAVNVLYTFAFYTKNSPRGVSLMKIVSFLIALMVVMVSVPSAVCMGLSWLGFGLVSHSFVTFYQGKKINRLKSASGVSSWVSDAFFFLSIALSMSLWLDMSNVSFITYFWLSAVLTLMMVTKLMEFCLSCKKPLIEPKEALWFPSALVCSCTLPAVVIYFMFRVGSDVPLKGESWAGLMVVGGVASLVVGSMGFFENKLNKFIFLSILSQVGLMFVMVSLGLLKLAYFHVISHSIFSALLLTCSGAMHWVGHCQDIRLVGSMSVKFPKVSSVVAILFVSMNLGPISLGVFSKSAALEAMFYGWMCAVGFVLCAATFLLGAIKCLLLFSSFWFPHKWPLSKKTEKCKNTLIKQGLAFVILYCTYVVSLRVLWTLYTVFLVISLISIAFVVLLGRWPTFWIEVKMLVIDLQVRQKWNSIFIPFLSVYLATPFVKSEMIPYGLGFYL